MSRPEPIGRTYSVRGAKAARAVVALVEEGGVDLRGVELEDVQRAVAEVAEREYRDLTPEEVAKLAREAIASEVDRIEQEAAEESVASARREQEAVEQEARARYSAACAAAWRRGDPTPDPPRPGVAVFALDPRGSK